MSDTIVYIDRSEIRSTTDLGDLRRAMADLVEFIKEREPQLISYGFFIDESASEMTVVAIHPDSASIELHMEVGGPRFRAFADLINLRSIEVYGRPSQKVMDQLHQKAQALGDHGRVWVHEQQAGFARVPRTGNA